MNEINPPKCIDLDYINFLITSSRIFSCAEASECSFLDSNISAHDSFTRLLLSQPPDTEALWGGAKDLVTSDTEFFIIDDIVLDKLYSKCMDLVYRKWSDKHHQIVNGIRTFSGKNKQCVESTYYDGNKGISKISGYIKK